MIKNYMLDRKNKRIHEIEGQHFKKISTKQAIKN